MAQLYPSFPLLNSNLSITLWSCAISCLWKRVHTCRHGHRPAGHAIVLYAPAQANCMQTLVVDQK